MLSPLKAAESVHYWQPNSNRWLGEDLTAGYGEGVFDLDLDRSAAAGGGGVGGGDFELLYETRPIC